MRHLGNPTPLGAYPVTMAERLEHWAAVAPERLFLGERAGAGWRTITYGEFRRVVLETAQELKGKTWIEISLGNGIEHAVLAMAAMYAGVPYVPLRPGASRTVPPVADYPVVKWLFTSGSTGEPKAVAQTQRMLTSNQEMLRHAIPQLQGEPPVLCDWLPWHHTYGGNHNFGIALYNGGTLWVDGGTPEAIAESVRNLREIRPTIYFNVPRGFQALVRCLREDAEFARDFVSRLQVMFCAGASLPDDTRDELRELTGIPMLTGYGATETGPIVLCCGLPVPGVEVKLVEREGRQQLCVRGPNVSPSVEADGEGFYRTGDAFRWDGRYVFEGRFGKNFKLSSGTWVRADELRREVMACCEPWLRDVVFSGEGEDNIKALLFPAPDAPRDKIEDALRKLAARNVGSSRHIGRTDYCWKSMPRS